MNLIKISALVVLLASAIFASAATIQLGSYATGQTDATVDNTALNFSGFSALSQTPATGFAPTYLLDPGTYWIAPLANSTYVGYSPTAGPVGTVNPAFGYYTFNTMFLATGFYSGSISILADDTTSVYLDGVLIVPLGSLGGDSHCADGTPTCTVLSTYDIGITALTATNTLTFVVQQAAPDPVGGVNDSSGLDFHATLTTAVPVTPTPEPGSLLLLGTGLLGSAGAFLRRMRS